MKKIALFLSIVVAAIACDKVEPITPPEVDFANPDVVIPFAGCDEEAPVTIEFKANVDWTAELIADETADGEPWISISPKSGKAGEAVINIVAAENELEATRAAQVKVTVGVSVLNFDIVQEGIPYLTTEPETVSLPANGGSATVKVDANVEYIVKTTPVEWLTADFNEETGEYTLTAVANTAYASRSVTFTLSNELKGVSYSFVVTQEGKAKILWEKALADYTEITLGNPIHLAYKDGLLALSTGSAVHVLNSQDGSYMMPVSLPEGFVVSSLTNDDAGNVVLAGNIAAYATGDVYAISSLETLEPVKVATMQNDVYSYNAGNLRAGGDVTKNGVLSMFVDVSQYWIACDIVDGEAGTTQFGAITPLEGAGTAWECANGCVTPLGSSIADGFLATYYTSPGLVSNASGEWALVGDAIYTGNDNNCAIAEAVYGDTHFAAVAVGSHFNYSATGLYLYDLANSEVVYSYRIDGDLVNTAGATADAVLVPTDDALLMYYADLQKGKIVCIEIK